MKSVRHRPLMDTAVGALGAAVSTLDVSVAAEPVLPAVSVTVTAGS